MTAEFSFTFWHSACCSLKTVELYSKGLQGISKSHLPFEEIYCPQCWHKACRNRQHCKPPPYLLQMNITNLSKFQCKFSEQTTKFLSQCSLIGQNAWQIYQYEHVMRAAHKCFNCYWELLLLDFKYTINTKSTFCSSQFSYKKLNK